MDYVLLEKLVNKVKRQKGQENKVKLLELLVQQFTEQNDACMIAELTLNFPKLVNLKVAEDAILKIKHPRASFRFAKFIPNAKISQHEQIVLEANDPCLSELFSKIKGSNAKAHSKLILSNNRPMYSAWFIVDHPNVDRKLHEKVLQESNNPYYFYEAAKNSKGKNCESLEKYLLKMNNDVFSYLYAIDVPGANIPAHENVVLGYGDPEQVFLFAKDVPTSNIKRHINYLVFCYKDNPTEELLNYIKQLKEIQKSREAKQDQPE